MNGDASPFKLSKPVLFLVFNRPDTTRAVFEAIRAARPPRLYVAADGAREGRAGEAGICDQVRAIATAVDWPCQLTTLFRSTNLGCRVAVSDGISWFFEHEEDGIILEDDCLPTASFFRFCETLLDRYKNEESVGVISGNNFQSPGRPYDASYYFTKYAHIWGWASWRRYWQHYDRDLKQADLPQVVSALQRISEGDRYFVRYWGNLFLRLKKDSGYSWKHSILPSLATAQTPPRYPIMNTWDYQVFFSGLLRREQTVHAVPMVNLVRNLGFGGGGTHVIAGSHNPADKAGELVFPLTHPARIARDVNADRYIDRHHYQIGFKTTLWQSLGQTLPGLKKSVMNAKALWST